MKTIIKKKEYFDFTQIIEATEEFCTNVETMRSGTRSTIMSDTVWDKMSPDLIKAKEMLEETIKLLEI